MYNKNILEYFMTRHIFAIHKILQNFYKSIKQFRDQSLFLEYKNIFICQIYFKNWINSLTLFNYSSNVLHILGKYLNDEFVVRIFLDGFIFSFVKVGSIQ